MSSNTKFIIVSGDDTNDDDDADDEQLLIAGGDKNADAFATIFTEQLAIYSLRSSLMMNSPITNQNLLSFSL